MTGKKPNVILIFKKVKEEEMGNYRMLSCTSFPKKIWSKSFGIPHPTLQTKESD